MCDLNQRYRPRRAKSFPGEAHAFTDFIDFVIEAFERNAGS